MSAQQPKTSQPRDYRIRWYAAIGVAAIAVAAYLLYETGRIHAGYNRSDVAAERGALNRKIQDLEGEVARLNERVAQVETMRKTDREAYQGVEDNLAQLQAKIQEQREAIAFYRGIISPSNSMAGLRIHDLQVLRGGEESRYRLRLVLVQVKQHHREVYGTVRMSVDGARGGEAVSYPISQLMAKDEKRNWSYGFRYFQDFERELVLPDGFTPLTVNIELIPKGRGNVGLKESFPWSTSPDQGIS